MSSSLPCRSSRSTWGTQTTTTSTTLAVDSGIRLCLSILPLDSTSQFCLSTRPPLCSSLVATPLARRPGASSSSYVGAGQSYPASALGGTRGLVPEPLTLADALSRSTPSEIAQQRRWHPVVFLSAPAKLGRLGQPLSVRVYPLSPARLRHPTSRCRQ